MTPSIRRPTGPQGEVGKTGPTGATGPAGQAGVTEETIWKKLNHRQLARDIWTFIIASFLVLAAIQGKRTSDYAKGLALKIQHERYDSAYYGCQDQNRRHNNTITALDNAFVVAEQSGEAKGISKKALKQSIKSNIALINALAPYQNCTQVAKKVVSRPN